MWCHLIGIDIQYYLDIVPTIAVAIAISYPTWTTGGPNGENEEKPNVDHRVQGKTNRSYLNHPALLSIVLMLHGLKHHACIAITKYALESSNDIT